MNDRMFMSVIEIWRDRLANNGVDVLFQTIVGQLHEAKETDCDRWMRTAHFFDSLYLTHATRKILVLAAASSLDHIPPRLHSLRDQAQKLQEEVNSQSHDPDAFQYMHHDLHVRTS